MHWAHPDDRTLGAWNNRTDTTEMGAYACVIAAAELVRGQYALRRAETNTGADYYVGPADAGRDDLENCFRLEISGTDVGTRADVLRRTHDKVTQTRNGDSNLPAIAGVIGFAECVIVLRRVEVQP